MKRCCSEEQNQPPLLHPLPLFFSTLSPYSSILFPSIFSFSTLSPYSSTLPFTLLHPSSSSTLSSSYPRVSWRCGATWRPGSGGSPWCPACSPTPSSTPGPTSSNRSTSGTCTMYFGTVLVEKLTKLTAGVLLVCNVKYINWWRKRSSTVILEIFLAVVGTKYLWN